MFFYVFFYLILGLFCKFVTHKNNQDKLQLVSWCNEWKCHPVQEEQVINSFHSRREIFCHANDTQQNPFIVIFPSFRGIYCQREKHPSFIPSCTVVYSAVSCLDNNRSWSVHKDPVLRSKNALKSALKCLGHCEQLQSLLLHSSTLTTFCSNHPRRRNKKSLMSRLPVYCHCIFFLLPFCFIFLPLFSWLSHVHIKLLIWSRWLSDFNLFSLSVCTHYSLPFW